MLAVLTRIAEALERAAPPATQAPDFAAADAFVWRADGLALTAVAKVSRVEMALEIQEIATDADVVLDLHTGDRAPRYLYAPQGARAAVRC